jgi:hypothetical protein
MPIDRPYRRTCRQFTDGSNDRGGHTGYILHSKYANSPQHYIRAFLLIQKDLLELFDFVEPSDVNLKCYSYRIHELHTRACIEIEANCKAILTENGYVKSGHLNMTDYNKLNATHRLSSYKIKLPLWHGTQDTRVPFTSWATGGALAWYKAYNETKHDRYEQFEQANFDNLLNAVSGLVAVLSAQFHTRDFAPLDHIVGEGSLPGWDVAIGSNFLVKFPDDWPDSDKYDFNWQSLENESDPFRALNFL